MLRRDIVEVGLSESQIQWLVNEAAKSERRKESDKLRTPRSCRPWKGEVSALMNAAMELGGLNLFEWSDMFQAALARDEQGSE